MQINIEIDDLDSFIESIDLENAAVSKKEKTSGYILLESNSVSQGPFCWLDNNHKAVFWHERASKENSIMWRLGYSPLNPPFPGSHAHHLHLENNSGFCINLPFWIHNFYPHFKRKPDTLETINAVALDFLINEDIYTELFHIKRYQ